MDFGQEPAVSTQCVKQYVGGGGLSSWWVWVWTLDNGQEPARGHTECVAV
jgi:hypothetical protein